MHHPLNLPQKLRQRVDRELQPGERIRWIEQPASRLSYLILSSMPVMLFAIPWTAFSIFWICDAAGFKLPDLSQGIKPEHLFPLFGLPFTFIGLGMLSTPFWLQRRMRNTVYLITDQRAISFEGNEIRSYDPEQLGNIFRKERADGTGDVFFATHTWRDSDGDRHSRDIGFMSIRNPQAVERQLKELHASSQ